MRTQQPVEGWLYLGQCPKKYFPKRIAQLQDPEDRTRLVLPELGDASVIGIKKGGLMIFGNEGFSASQPIWQRWWVIPGVYDDRLAQIAGEPRPPLHPESPAGKVTAAA
ncbi:hypothetical protein [Pseudacidovorax intermedius]|uniref:hypothetical protein n=1 Tax=Pseudacidovorax intermedius TaxID=433924 RepID=UPI00034DAC65|nr:hypothetical protein [Pseudacidovorax intermedius]